MDDPGGDHRWLSYSELAEARSISRASAIRLVRKHRWPRRTNNAGVVTLAVPVAFTVADRRDAPGDGPDDRPSALAVLAARAERAEQRADEANKRADVAVALADRTLAQLARGRDQVGEATGPVGRGRGPVQRGLRRGYGGRLGRREDHWLAAARELQEELGVAIDRDTLRLVVVAPTELGLDYLYEARVTEKPKLVVDHREVVEARFVHPGMLCEVRYRDKVGDYVRHHAGLGPQPS
jgi:hypothetical protein